MTELDQLSNTYRAIHKWVRNRIEKPDICPCCEENAPTDCANYTGIYDRNLDNYVYICRPCHQKLDFATGDRAFKGNRYCRK